MANTTVHAAIQDQMAPPHTAARSSAVTTMVTRLRKDLGAPPTSALDDASSAIGQGAFLSRFIVLQGIGAALVAALWIAGVAGEPFQGGAAALCWIILAIGALGILCVFLQRWRDVQWLATHVVRIGLLGTVVGLIVAFSAAATGDSSNPEAVKTMIGAVIGGMYVSLYATLLGIATNLWLKINLRLLGNFHG
jgi:hypothetical protein